MSDSPSFDLFANDYDAWFGQNRDLLESEVRLLAHAWPGEGEALSVGCGTGLFETILAREHGVHITRGIEPAEGMAAIARSRGMDVTLGTAEAAELGESNVDILLYNGSTSYIPDLAVASRRPTVRFDRAVTSWLSMCPVSLATACSTAWRTRWAPGTTLSSRA